MKYAIISDIHANETALRRVLDDAAAAGAEEIVCLGDVVGYGPLPRETVALVRASAAVTLAGNHDDAVSHRRGTDCFIDLAEDAVRRHRAALGSSDLNWLKSLPYDCRFGEAVAAHGDFVNPQAFNYVETEHDARLNFAATDAPFVFVGHTHVPCVFQLDRDGRVRRLEPHDFTLADGVRCIVNPGSVGYPRTIGDTCVSTYAIYDSTERAIRFRRLPFSVSSVMQRGTEPRRTFGLIAALLTFAATVLVAALLLRTPGTRTETAKPDITTTANAALRDTDERQSDSALTVAEKSLTLKSEAKFVRANLKLVRKSTPAVLCITFKSPTGKVVAAITKTVKSSLSQKIKIPADAKTAHFAVRRESPATQPQIQSFAPTAE